MRNNGTSLNIVTLNINFDTMTTMCHCYAYVEYIQMI